MDRLWGDCLLLVLLNFWVCEIGDANSYKASSLIGSMVDFRRDGVVVKLNEEGEDDVCVWKDGGSVKLPREWEDASSNSGMGFENSCKAISAALVVVVFLRSVDIRLPNDEELAVRPGDANGAGFLRCCGGTSISESSSSSVCSSPSSPSVRVGSASLTSSSSA